jgi:hypothetical protein
LEGFLAEIVQASTGLIMADFSCEIHEKLRYAITKIAFSSTAIGKEKSDIFAQLIRTKCS